MTHKNSQVGQSRSQAVRQTETGDGKASQRETGSNVKEGEERREEWQRGQQKEFWDKSTSGLKRDHHEWREVKGSEGQLQASNNSRLISRTGHQFVSK